MTSRTLSARRLLAAGALVTGIAACAGGARPETTVQRPITEVQADYTPAWMDLPGVVGTALGMCDDRECIKVFVEGPLASIRERIPREVEGYPVVLEGTDPVRAREPGFSV